MTNWQKSKGIDPVICAQNTSQSLKIDEPTFQGNNATINVHAEFGSGANTIKVGLIKTTQTYELSDTKQLWQINTITCNL